MTATCPFCHGKRHLHSRSYSRADILRWYQEDFSLDVSGWLGDAAQIDLLRCIDCQVEFFDPMIEGGGKLYDQLRPIPVANPYLVDKHEYRHVLGLLARIKPASVLDIGCGDGHFLKKLRGAFDVAGAEQSQSAVASLQAAGIALDTPGRQYGFVTLFQVLEHVADAKGFLEFAIGKVAPGGHLYIGVPEPGFALDIDYVGASMVPPHHVTQWSRQALEGIAERYGLEAVEYFQEPITYEDAMSRLRHRQRRYRWIGYPDHRLKDRLLRLFYNLFDRLYTYHFFLTWDRDPHPKFGHTHGLLLRKPAGAAAQGQR